MKGEARHYHLSVQLCTIPERLSPLCPIQFHVNWPVDEPRPSRQNVEFLTFIQTVITHEVLTAQETHRVSIAQIELFITRIIRRMSTQCVGSERGRDLKVPRNVAHTHFSEYVKKNKFTLVE